jgi:hypothetical protein
VAPTNRVSRRPIVEALHLRETGRESEEDRVADVMDFLVGFCSPQARL